MSGDKVRAELIIELNVKCPECSHWLDLVSDTNLDYEGQLLEDTVGAKNWQVASKHFSYFVICPECSVEFEIDGFDW